MLEGLYKYAITKEKIIEKIIDDQNIHLNHMILRKGEGLPEHFSNSNVYMILIQGEMTIQLDEQDAHTYTKGDIIKIPYKTKMNVKNEREEVLEFFVVKAPNPRDYRGDE